MIKKVFSILIVTIVVLSILFLGCKIDEPTKSVAEESEITEDASTEVEEVEETETEEVTEEAAEEKSSVSDITIGVVINTLRHPYYVQIVEGYEKVAEELGVSIIIKDPDQDANMQVSMIEELIDTHNVDALCVDPCLPGALASIVEEAAAKGIPLVAGAGHIPGEVCFIGSDNYVGGRLAGAYAGEWLLNNVEGTPVIGIIESTRYPIPNLRIPGYIEGVREFVPDAIIEIRDSEANKADAMTAMEDILTQYDRVDATFGINDPASLGAYAACEAKFGAENMIACGFDCDPDGIAALKDPDSPAWMADVAQFTDLITKCMVVIAIRASRGEDVPSRIWAPCKLATRDSIDEVLSSIPEYEECSYDLVN